MTVEAGDKISLAVEPHTKFSVWVSFCEIYNENIHDLLEVTPNGATRRTALRLSQDVKGNAFVRGLKGRAGAGNVFLKQCKLFRYKFDLCSKLSRSRLIGSHQS